MPVVVACKCGQRFSAADHLYGKRVDCPACGGPLQVPAPKAAPAAVPARSAPQRAPVAAAPTATAKGIKAICACGQAVLAPETMRGKTARCPGCGGPLHIPGPAASSGDLLSADPLLMGGDPLSSAAASPLAPSRPQPAPSPAAATTNQPPWLLIGLGGGAVAVVLVIVTWVVASSMSGRPVAQAPPPNLPAGAAGAMNPPSPSSPPSVTPPSAPAAPGPPSSSSSSTSPSPSSTSAGSPFSAVIPSSSSSSPPAKGTASEPAAGSKSSSASAFRDATPTGGMDISFLPSAVQSWHTDQSLRRRGLVRVGDAETPYGHFSWMTQLLPFLGHQKEYDRIDFNRELTIGRNLVVGTEVIPAFLNPLDNRQTWKGHPFDGLALTHFAGMAGVEDTRNVVAASLPRSDPRAGVFGYEEVADASEITDGASQTIMVIGTGTIANPWILGGGATIRGAREPYFDKVSGFGTRNLPQAGSLAVMADGSVRFVSANVEPTVFRSMCTIHGRDTVDLERGAAPFLLDSIVK